MQARGWVELGQLPSKLSDACTSIIVRMAQQSRKLAKMEVEQGSARGLGEVRCAGAANSSEVRTGRAVQGWPGIG